MKRPTTAAETRVLARNRRTDAFERRAQAALDGLVEDGATVLVACSGGPDSLAMLAAAARALGAERVVAAHFDHRLRPAEEVASEREIVQAVAEALGARCVAGRASRVPRSQSEDAARRARYRWLARACVEAGARVCLTGHTLDDQAETVLLRLARGTAAGGAAGMAAESPWPIEARGARELRLVRPLLGLTREDVEGYLEALRLAAAGLGPAEDPSNRSLGYARNRVRLRVLPELRAVNARAAEHLARFALHQREDDEVLAALARSWLDQHARIVATGIEIDRVALRTAAPAVARRAVWLAAQRLGVSLEAAHIESILGSLGRGGSRIDLPVAYTEVRATVLTLQARPSPSGTD